MYLDELNDLVQTLGRRITEHREILAKNEAATRYAIVDPLLNALGWDTSDPAIVEPEYQSGSGYADYVLKGADGDPSIIVEAKRLGRSINDGINQSITYCIGRGIKFFVVTNGDQWRAYETYKPVPIEQKQLLNFSVSRATQPTVMTMLWLWRGNFASNEPEFPPELPVQTPVPSPASSKPPTGAATKEVPLSGYAWSSGRPRPAAIRFPDGTSKPISSWRQLQISAVEWLFESGRLTVADCPVTDRDGGVYLINSKPERRNGSRFSRPKSIYGMWIEVQYRDQIRMTKRILISRDISLDEVKLVHPE